MFWMEDFGNKNENHIGKFYECAKIDNLNYWKWGKRTIFSSKCFITWSYLITEWCDIFVKIVATNKICGEHNCEYDSRTVVGTLFTI